MTTFRSNQAGAGRRGRKGAWRALLLAATVAILPACENFLDVSSPSLAEDRDLEGATAMLTLLRGVQGDFVHAAAGEAGQGGTYMAGALLTDELVHAGIWRGHRSFSDGYSRDDWQEVEEIWAAASQARWTAEHLVPRIAGLRASGVEEDAEENLANLHAASMLWAGLINRMMGDSFCNAVIDEGPMEDNRVFHERAEDHLTAAIALATELGRDTIRQAAHAGRAQARMMMGDWAGAVADAAEVETFHIYQQTHAFLAGREREWNWIMRSIQSDQAETTVWGTPFGDWGRLDGTTVGDPRVRYTTVAAVPFGRDGRRPFWRMRKYIGSGDNIAVTRGTEMRLIEAEARLVAGDWQGAVDKINEVRVFRRSAQGGLPAADRTVEDIPDVSATDATEAWELLMRERGIEFWLEGRRLPDMRRWAQTPGTVPTTVVRQAGSGAPEDDPRLNVLEVVDGMCIPVSLQEKRTNPSIQG